MHGAGPTMQTRNSVMGGDSLSLGQQQQPQTHKGAAAVMQKRSRRYLSTDKYAGGVVGGGAPAVTARAPTGNALA